MELLKTLPPDVKDKLLETVSGALAKLLGAPSPEILLLDTLAFLYPGHVVKATSLAQLETATKVFEDTGSAKAAIEAVAETAAKEALEKAARH